METITEQTLEPLRAATVKAWAAHNNALADMPLGLTEAHLAWLGRVEITHAKYRAALDRYTAAMRLRSSLLR